MKVLSYEDHLVQDDFVDPVANVVHGAGLACRLGRCFCLRQRCPPDTRTPRHLVTAIQIIFHSKYLLCTLIVHQEKQKEKCAFNDKNPSADFPTEGFFLDIQRYFYVSPAKHSVLGGVGVQVFLRVGFGERKLSELEGRGTYCASNKVPRHPLEIFDFGSGSGSYFMPSLIAA